jgi:hypothetical protein
MEKEFIQLMVGITFVEFLNYLKTSQVNIVLQVEYLLCLKWLIGLILFVNLVDQQ